MPKPKSSKLPHPKPEQFEQQDENPEKNTLAAADKDLKKISLHVNAFGQIVRDIKTEEINAFLDENVPDKKLDEH